MRFTVVIPARFASSRLPEKPLLPIEGVPMVVRVAQQATQTEAERVVVATDHEAIAAVCKQWGVEALMTRADHPTGTDRLAEAAIALGLPDDAVVVNLQGDEPLMPPAVVDRVARALEEHPDCHIATAAHRIENVDAFFNPNVVKVTVDQRGQALTFSRAPMPWARDHFRDTKASLPADFPALHHLGLYAYRAGFLKAYPTLAQCRLEQLESLEQLRALYYGYRIAVETLDEPLPAGVDTAEDLERVRAEFARRTR